MLTEVQVIEALKAVKYPGYSRDIVSFGLVKHIAITEGAISVSMNVTSNNPEVIRQIKTECEQVLRTIPGAKVAYVDVQHPPSTAGPAPAHQTPWNQQNR